MTPKVTVASASPLEFAAVPSPSELTANPAVTIAIPNHSPCFRVDYGGATRTAQVLTALKGFFKINRDKIALQHTTDE